MTVLEMKWLAVALCVVGAAIGAAAKSSGWGWFLLVALLLSSAA
jgi:hypothetical protein